MQVLDRSGHFVRLFGEDKLCPLALHIVDNYVYVSTHRNIAMYRTSGQFVTSFGDLEFFLHSDSCITSCVDSLIYVCDFQNK